MTHRIVKQLMTDYPEMRVGSKLLEAHIWEVQAEELGITTIEEFLENYKNGNLSYSGGIRAAACTVRQKHPELKPTTVDTEGIREQYANQHNDYIND